MFYRCVKNNEEIRTAIKGCQGVFKLLQDELHQNKTEPGPIVFHIITGAGGLQSIEQYLTGLYANAGFYVTTDLLKTTGPDYKIEIFPYGLMYVNHYPMFDDALLSGLMINGLPVLSYTILASTTNGLYQFQPHD